MAFPYGADSKCDLTGGKLRGNGAARDTERERGQDDYKFDIPQRDSIGRMKEKESVAKCGLPDETGRAWEKRK